MKMTSASNLADGIKLDQDDHEIIEQQLSTSIINQVLKVLEDGLEKIKVALMIPEALNTPDYLKQYLFEDDINILLDKCKTYFDDLLKDENNDDFILNYHLSKSIESLYYDLRFRRHILNYNVKETSKLSFFFLKQIEDIFNIAAIRLQTPAGVDLLREKLVQESCRENESLKKHIDAWKKQLRGKESVLEEKINEEKETMNAYKGNLEEAYTAYQIEMKKARHESCQKIIQITSSSEAAQERLKIETEGSILNYKNILKNNLVEEKKIREKKQRVLAQLLALIEKYDNDMVERSMEIIRMKDQIVLKTKELKNFMIVFEKKKEEYMEVFKDVDEGDVETRRQAKIWNFQMNHAAKVIQKGWRAYRATKKKKGKGKGKAKPADKPKGGKGKKEPAEKAAVAKAQPKGKGKKSKKTEVEAGEKIGTSAEAKRGEKEKETVNETATEKQLEGEEEKEAASEVVTEKQQEGEEVNAEETKEAEIEENKNEKTEEDQPEKNEEGSKGKAKEEKEKGRKKKKK